MRFRALSLLAGVAVLALTAGGALAAADSQDQHQDAAAFDAGDHGTAQTFKAGVSGQLDRVSLWGMTTGWTITVDLRDGGPTGTLLGTSSTATPATDGAWFDAIFSPTVHVTAGSTYAIVLNPSGAARIGGTCAADAYSDGQALGLWSNVWQTIPGVNSFDSCITDFAFSTYVAATATPPTVAMAFGAASIPVGGTTSLTYTITNPNAATAPVVRPALPGPGALTNIGFTDTLPAGLVIATPNNIGGGCGGSITATAGTNLVSITGLTLAAGASCGFGIDVIGTTAGTKNNATTAITSTEAGVGNSASASIVVAAPATPTPAPTAAPTATPTAAPTATPTAAPTATRTAAPTATPPTTSTVDHRGPGSEAPLLLFLALTAIAGLLLTGLLLRPESRVRRR